MKRVLCALTIIGIYLALGFAPVGSVAAATDGAALASQGDYPTVEPGEQVQIWINVRNTGQTTWRAEHGFGYRGTGQWANQAGPVWRSVSPGDILSFSKTITAPQQPGQYIYGFIMQHNGVDFGPHFFIQVTVEPPYVLPFVVQTSITNGPGCGPTHGGSGYEASYEALDFGLGLDTPLYPTRDGEIVYAVYGNQQNNYNDGFGNLMKIHHGNGTTSWYAHLNSFVRTSGWVTTMDLVAYSGNSGYSSGSHLHFEVRDGNNRSVWIRTMPGITWYSGDPNNPCQPAGYPDGEADGASR